MGASSVTGVGKGAAYGLKGPGNKRDFGVPLSAPHVVAAGTVYVTGGSVKTVALPDVLPLTPDRYVVMTNSFTLTSNTNGVPVITNPYACGGIAVDVNGIGAIKSGQTSSNLPNNIDYAANVVLNTGKTSGTASIYLFAATSCYVNYMVVVAGSNLDVNEAYLQTNAVPGNTGVGYQFP